MKAIQFVVTPSNAADEILTSYAKLIKLASKTEFEAVAFVLNEVLPKEFTVEGETSVGEGILILDTFTGDSNLVPVHIQRGSLDIDDAMRLLEEIGERWLRNRWASIMYHAYDSMMVLLHKDEYNYLQSLIARSPDLAVMAKFSFKQVRLQGDESGVPQVRGSDLT